MNYEIFKKVVEEKFLEYMPEEYKDMKVRVALVNKINTTLDGISLISDQACISPTLYINDMYKNYLCTKDLNSVLSNAAIKMHNAFKNMPVFNNLDFDNVNDNIIAILVNTEQNQEMLAGVPHREYMDLSIIYRWVVKVDEDGMQSILITNNLAEKLKFTEQQMYDLAIGNTRTLFPAVIKPLNDFLIEMCRANGIPEELAEEFSLEDTADNMMLLITNDRKINGANAILYDEILEIIAEQIGNDFYILPSSIHEVIAVSTSIGEPSFLASMVRDINNEHVMLEERLSNNVYYYDRHTRRLTLDF